MKMTKAEAGAVQVLADELCGGRARLTETLYQQFIEDHEESEELLRVREILKGRTFAQFVRDTTLAGRGGPVTG